MKYYWYQARGDAPLFVETVNAVPLSDKQAHDLIGYNAITSIEGVQVVTQEQCVSMMYNSVRCNVENIDIVSVHAHHHRVAGVEDELRIEARPIKQRRNSCASVLVRLERPSDGELISEAEMVLRLWPNEESEEMQQRPAPFTVPSPLWEARLPFPANRLALEEIARSWVGDRLAPSTIMATLEELGAADPDPELENRLSELAALSIQPLPAFAQGDDDQAFRLDVTEAGCEFLLLVGPHAEDFAPGGAFERSVDEAMIRYDDFVQDIASVRGQPTLFGDTTHLLAEQDEGLRAAGKAVIDVLELSSDDAVAVWESDAKWSYVAVLRHDGEMPVFVVAGVVTK